jgi:hypothetical protein
MIFSFFIKKKKNIVVNKLAAKLYFLESMPTQFQVVFIKKKILSKYVNITILVITATQTALKKKYI